MTTAVGRGLAPVRTELPSGAVVIVQETSIAPAATISASFRAGSVREPAELPGLAYFTGRVIDRGTEKRPAAAVAEELDDRGVSLKVSVDRHALTLSCTCLTEDFDDILEIVLDVARRPTFPDEEVEKRRSELLTALRQDADNPAVRAIQVLVDLLYGPEHPYGRPPKGTIESIERLSRARLAAFHSQFVRPSGLSLVIVGDVRPGHALERAARELEDWTVPAVARIDVPPLSTGPSRRTRRIDMPGKPQADIAYGFTAVRRLDPRYYAYWIMNNILGQFGLGGRLAENIRERQGMAYYAFSSFEPAHGEAPILIRAGVDPRNVGRAVAAIDHEVAALGAEGPTERELEESRQYLIWSIPRLLETNESIATFLQITEEFGLGLDYDVRLPSLLRSVTHDAVRAAAADTLHPDRAAVAIAGPPESGR